MTAEENLRLIQEIDANRRFLLLAYRSNPAMLSKAEPRIRALLGMPDSRDTPSAAGDNNGRDTN